MPSVDIKSGEPVDRALKRLKSILETEGIIEEMRRIRSFETKTEKLKRKARSAAKRPKIRFRFQNPKSTKNVDESAETPTLISTDKLNKE